MSGKALLLAKAARQSLQDYQNEIIALRKQNAVLLAACDFAREAIYTFALRFSRDDGTWPSYMDDAFIKLESAVAQAKAEKGAQ